MSLHTVVQGSFAGRLHPRREAAATPVQQRGISLPRRVSISSMRVLETCVALSAIATALLIGHR